MPPPQSPFNYETFGNVKTALALRLNDTANIRWTDVENGLYIIESLMYWNCLVQYNVQDFTQTYDSTALTWQALNNAQNSFVGSNPTSPRLQTLDDSYVYTVAEYHLSEPPTGSTWSGTNQFNINDLSQALQRRRDAVLQAAATFVGPFADDFGLPVGNARVYLPDTPGQSILDIRRIRFVPSTNQGSPSTLYREDGLSFEYFENDFTTLPSDTIPFGWDVLAGPPLALTFDAPASVPNTLDILAMISGGIISPPTSSPLLIPDDFYWVLKFGMMADLLSKESESTDLQRAAYCEQRFQEGIKLMVEMPWLLQARVNNLSVDTPAITNMDDFSYGWQDDPDAPQAIVRGGIDLFAISPTLKGTGYGEGGYGEGGYNGGDPVSVTLSLVANAPIPASDADFIQVSRDVLDSILDYAQHLAIFKNGGDEFNSSISLYQEFVRSANLTNKRLQMSGIFPFDLRPPVSKQTEIDPRFATAGE